MNQEKGKTFHSPSKGKLDLESVVQEIVLFMNDEPKSGYSIIVGSDSYPSHSVDYVTAIVVHRHGRGGRYFWCRDHTEGATPTLRNRMYQEALHSINLAQELLPRLQNEKLHEYDFEIHVDIGNSGKTKDMISEIVGMVRGYGYTAKTKPESYAASSIADKYT